MDSRVEANNSKNPSYYTLLCRLNESYRKKILFQEEIKKLKLSASKQKEENNRLQKQISDLLNSLEEVENRCRMEIKEKDEREKKLLKLQENYTTLSESNEVTLQMLNERMRKIYRQSDKLATDEKFEKYRENMSKEVAQLNRQISKLKNQKKVEISSMRTEYGRVYGRQKKMYHFVYFFLLRIINSPNSLTLNDLYKKSKEVKGSNEKLTELFSDILLDHDDKWTTLPDFEKFQHVDSSEVNKENELKLSRDLSENSSSDTFDENDFEHFPNSSDSLTKNVSNTPPNSINNSKTFFISSDVSSNIISSTSTHISHSQLLHYRLNQNNNNNNSLSNEGDSFLSDDDEDNLEKGTTKEKDEKKINKFHQNNSNDFRLSDSDLSDDDQSDTTIVEQPSNIQISLPSNDDTNGNESKDFLNLSLSESEDEEDSKITQIISPKHSNSSYKLLDEKENMNNFEGNFDDDGTNENFKRNFDDDIHDNFERNFIEHGTDGGIDENCEENKIEKEKNEKEIENEKNEKEIINEKNEEEIVNEKTAEQIGTDENFIEVENHDNVDGNVEEVGNDENCEEEIEKDEEKIEIEKDEKKIEIEKVEEKIEIEKNEKQIGIEKNEEQIENEKIENGKIEEEIEKREFELTINSKEISDETTSTEIESYNHFDLGEMFDQFIVNDDDNLMQNVSLNHNSTVPNFPTEFPPSNSTLSDNNQNNISKQPSATGTSGENEETNSGRGKRGQRKRQNTSTTPVKPTTTSKRGRGRPKKLSKASLLAASNQLQEIPMTITSTGTTTTIEIQNSSLSQIDQLMNLTSGMNHIEDTLLKKVEKKTKKGKEVKKLKSTPNKKQNNSTDLIQLTNCLGDESNLKKDFNIGRNAEESGNHELMNNLLISSNNLMNKSENSSIIDLNLLGTTSATSGVGNLDIDSSPIFITPMREVATLTSDASASNIMCTRSAPEDLSSNSPLHSFDLFDENKNSSSFTEFPITGFLNDDNLDQDLPPFDELVTKNLFGDSDDLNSMMDKFIVNYDDTPQFDYESINLPLIEDDDNNSLNLNSSSLWPGQSSNFAATCSVRGNIRLPLISLPPNQLSLNLHILTNRHVIIINCETHDCMISVIMKTDKSPVNNVPIIKRSQRYQCKFCNYRSHSVSLVQNHIYRHIHATPYMCRYCGHKSTTKSTIMVHIELCHPNQDIQIVENRVQENIYYDDLASDTATSNHPNSTIKTSSTNSSPLSSSSSSSLISSHQSNLSTNVKKDLEKKDVKNSSCLIHYQKNQLNETILNSIRESSEINRQQHSLLFNRPKQYFGSLYEPDKQYSCRLCSYTTNHRPSMEDHVFIHIDQRPYKCGYCNEEVYTRYAATYHNKYKHPKLSRNFIKNNIDVSSYYENRASSHRSDINRNKAPLQQTGKINETKMKDQIIPITSSLSTSSTTTITTTSTNSISERENVRSLDEFVKNNSFSVSNLLEKINSNNSPKNPSISQSVPLEISPETNLKNNFVHSPNKKRKMNEKETEVNDTTQKQIMSIVLRSLIDSTTKKKSTNTNSDELLTQLSECKSLFDVLINSII
ncbi:hypothetical protein SNEBB_007615 [Seison nebaliae]|nr:hypothetical protein SNEBB_007615 [Seison nebaliae]